MSELVGGIHYEVTLDTSKLIEGQREANRQVDKLGTSFTEVTRATKLYAAELQASAAAAREAAKGAEKLGDAAAKASAATAKQAISAKQMQAAMRGVPAQFTDIATSIASGQNPLTVLLQQGGQLKDMFGGLAPAAKALGSYIAGLINPLTVAGAAVGVFLVGLVKGGQEMQDFNRALVLTGSASGVTGDQLNTLAARLDSVAGVTRGQAAEALTVFAQLGIKGEESIGRFTEAALRLEQAGGPAVEKTAAQFKELGRAPLQASLKLNESVNFLTADLYKQIKALDDQGKHTEAARLAQNAYADAILERTPQVVENIGFIERAWRGVKNVAREGWDAILGIGRSQTPEEALEGTRRRIAQLQEQLASGGFASTAGGAATGRGLSPKQRAEAEQLVAVLQEQVKLAERGQLAAEGAAAAKSNEAKQVSAMADFDKSGQRFLSERQRMEREIVEARELGLRAGKSQVEIEQRIAAIRKSYEKTGSKFDAEAYIDTLRRASLEGEELLAARRDAELADAAKRKLTAEQLAAAKLAIEEKYNHDVAQLYERNQANALREAERNRKRIEDEGQADARQKQQDQGFAKGLIADGDPAAEVELWYTQTFEKIEAARQRDLENEELYSQALIAISVARQQKLGELADRRVEDEREAQLQTFAAVSSTTDLIIDVLAKGGKEKTALAKAAFLAQKAIAVAEIILNTQKGAAAALGMGPYGIPLATYIEVAGYAKAAIVAGLAIGQVAGGRQHGGPVSAGSMYRVNETGAPEMYTAANGSQYMLPTKSGKVTPANKVGGGGQQMQVIINNNHAGAEVSARQTESGGVEVTVSEIARQIRENSGPVWSALRSSSNVQGRL